MCCCREKLIGPWWAASHSRAQCRVWMPTGDEKFVTVYDAYPIPDWMPDVEYINREQQYITPFKYMKKNLE